MRPDNKYLQHVINALAIVAGLVVLVMMCHVVLDVFGKVAIGVPVVATTEIVSYYYMVAVIFLPLAYVTHNEGHIMVELFTRNMRPRPLARLEGFVGVLALALTVWFAWESIGSAWTNTAEGELAETAADVLQIWPSRWMLPIGLLVMGLYIAVRLVDDFRKAAGKVEIPPPPPPPAPEDI